MSGSALDISILGPAFLAGVLVLATHVPLGREVLARGIIFIDLAVAQVAGLGVIAANTFHLDPGGWGVQAAAVSAALAAAALLTWTERRFADVQEAIIGSLFIIAATGGILLLARNPHGGEALKDLLVGQILWVQLGQLWPVAGLYILVLGLWFGWRGRLSHAGFYALFAITVTASVQLVGVYLVFSSLIIPALATRSLAPRPGLVLGYIIGVLGYLAGLLISSLYDLPTGAVIVWTLTLVALCLAAISSRLHRFRGQRLPG